MSASIQGMGAALMPNLAFSLIMSSVQKVQAAPSTPAEDRGTPSPTTQLADSHQQIDVRA